MPSPQSAWIWIDLSPTIAIADQAQIIVKAVPLAGTIKSCVIGINTVLTTGGGTVAVAKDGVNILSSASYNLGAAATPDLVAATPEAATLTTAESTLACAANALLKATWTLTTVAVTNGACCLVAVEPATW